MNQGCSLCTTAVATCFCSCSRPEPLLCQSCVLIHFSKAPSRMHPVLPLQAYGAHKTPGYMERLQCRTDAVEAGKALLLRNLEAMDHCMAEFTQKVNDLINVIWQYGQTTIAQLTEEKATLERDIRESISEAERTLYEDNPILQEPFTALLKEYVDSRPNSLQLFSYQISSSELPVPLTSCLKYSVSTSQRHLYRLYKNSLLIFDIATEATRQISLEATFPPESRYCFPSSTTLVSIGGKDVTSINLTTFKVAQHQQLASNHAFPGLIAINQETYVFAGMTVSCEKLRADFTVCQLPCMKIAVDGFSPCKYGDEVYLPEYRLKNIEVFSLTKCAFRTLPLQLPNIQNNSVAFFSSETLFILTCNSQLAFMMLSQDSAFTNSTLQLSNSNSGQGACPPTVLGGKAYWFAAHSGDLVIFDLEAKTVAERQFVDR